MRNTPVNYQIVRDKLSKSGLEGQLDLATIREIVRLVNEIEAATGQKYVRMEMGVPGLNPPELMIEAEIQALKDGVASKYPMIEGIKELKEETARFVKLFMNIDVEPQHCVPAVGSMQSAFALFLVINRLREKQNKILFIDPGFPVQKQQCDVLGIKYDNFDIYDYRGDKLREKLESYFKTGEFSAVLYSNPNNPTWISFTEKELQIIGELATKYNVVVIEDIAYFGMDFRKDISKPGVPPYQSTVANYTDNYTIMISSSKIFSFGGERVGMIVVSPKLFVQSFPHLKNYYKTDKFGYSLIYGALYALSAGVNHSAQKAVAAILKAVNDGKYNFVEGVKPYAERAKIMKKIFLENGFYLVYDNDEGKPLSDGFYFTVHYPGMTTDELLEELLYYGISAISLKITGSKREGIRACVSQVLPEMFPVLEERVKQFHKDHSRK